MSCCGGNCGCGSGCKCGSSCGGCKMYPNLEGGASVTVAPILGVAPPKAEWEGFSEGAVENDGCKCGPNCSCNPCTCK